MSILVESYAAVVSLLQLGGPVIWFLVPLCIFMWLLILERFWFVFRTFPVHQSKLVNEWSHFSHANSWSKIQVRDSLLSEAKSSLRKNVNLIGVSIALCPMFGLLGTVLGMMLVFDTIGIMGTSDSRTLSSGISMATIPTVVGLCIALSGYFFHIKLKSLITKKTIQLSDMLVSE